VIKSNTENIMKKLLIADPTIIVSGKKHTINEKMLIEVLLILFIFFDKIIELIAILNNKLY